MTNVEAGQIVRVRSRQYLVEDVVPKPSPTEDTLVRLSCLDDDALGEALELLWEREVDAQYRTHLRSQEEAASRLSISRTKQRLILVVA